MAVQLAASAPAASLGRLFRLIASDVGLALWTESLDEIGLCRTMLLLGVKFKVEVFLTVCRARTRLLVAVCDVAVEPREHGAAAVSSEDKRWIFFVDDGFIVNLNLPQINRK